MRKYISVSVVGLSFLMIFIPLLAHSHPGSMMHGDMDDEQMNEYMGKRGYMYGPGRRHMQGVYPQMPMMFGNMMGPMPGQMMPGMMMGNMAGLDLNSGQRSKIRDIQRSMRKQHLKLMEQMMDAVDKLSDAYEEQPADTEKLGKAYDEVYRIKRNMILQHVETRNKIASLLNDEQKGKFKSNGPFFNGPMMMH